MRLSIKLLVAGCTPLVIFNTGCSKDSSSGAWSPPTFPVQVSSAKTEDVTLYAKGKGYVVAENQVSLASEAPGRVEFVAFQSGQFVQKGDLLIRLNSAAEKAEKERLTAQLTLAKKEFSRRESVVGLGVSQSDLDSLKLNIDLIQASIKKLEVDINKKKIFAPFSGRVGIRDVYLGQVVNASDTVVSVTDVSHLHVFFDFPERFLKGVSLGGKAVLRFPSLEGVSVEASITAIEPHVSTQAHTVRVQASFTDSTERIIPGIFAQVDVPTTVLKQRVVLPDIAIESTTYGHSVFVVNIDGDIESVSQRNIIIGPRFDNKVVIEKGIDAGESVVMFGQNRLWNGVNVKSVDFDSLAVADQ